MYRRHSRKSHDFNRSYNVGFGNQCVLGARARLPLDPGLKYAEYSNGIPYEEAIEVGELLRDAIVVGHNVLSDFLALGLSIQTPAHCL